jgi:two-component system, OmpR family, phosphate regulon sensor histidine kinase PhoR
VIREPEHSNAIDEDSLAAARRRHVAWTAVPVVLVFAALVALRQLDVGTALIGGLAVLAGVAVASATIWRDARAVLRYVQRLTETAADVRAAPADLDSPLADELTQAIHRLRNSLTKDHGRFEARAGAADAMLETLPDAVMLLGAGRQVVRANRAAVELAGADIVGRDVSAGLRHPAILAAVDAALAERGAARDLEVVLPLPNPRPMRVRVVPLPRAAGADAAAIAVFHDLTDIKLAEQMRADFIANASHELRTPLASLLGYIETLRGAAEDDAPAREKFLGIMHEQAERMARLVRDLLSLSQIELQERTPPDGAVDLAKIAADVAEASRLAAAAKNMTITVAAEGNLPPVAGDRDELTQVVQNLVDNAVNYGGTAGAVRIQLRRATFAPVFSPSGHTVRWPQFGAADAAVALSVEDSGPGIPRLHLPRLTERFYRVEPSRSRAQGGTGLGLAIVKHILARHRGGLVIESAEGRGSTFTIFLPLAGAAKPAH